MTQSLPPRDGDPTSPRLRRHARRGIVANYIHELSERHGRGAETGDAPAERGRVVESVLEPERGETLA